MVRRFSFLLLCMVGLSLSGAPAASDQNPTPPTPPVALSGQEPVVPPDLDKALTGSGRNWLQVRVNQSVARAIRERRLSLEALNEYLFLMTVPNFVYRGDAGEERLGNDMMDVLGTIKTGENAVIMELQWAEMRTMKLPFKKKLTDTLLFPEEYFKNDIDLTFFLDVNVFTARIGSALSADPKVRPIYNSQQKFYRLKRDDLACIFIVNIPNIAYEMVYTGEPFENVIKSYLKEKDLLFGLMEKYEPKLRAIKDLSYDGRYIKGKDIFIDLWFLYARSKGDPAAAAVFIDKALKREPVTVSGSEKGGAAR